MKNFILNQKATCNDVARLAGISIATVSNVLNRPGVVPVSKETREKVIRCATMLGYRPNRVAASLGRGKAQTLGVVTNGISDDFYFRILHGIETKCLEKNYMMIPISVPDIESNPERGKLLLQEQVSGLIIVGNRFPKEISLWIEMTLPLQIPVILVDQRFPQKKIDCVFADDFQGGKTATDHLLKMGHRRIGLITGSLDLTTVQDRKSGYENALKQNGVSVDQSIVLTNFQSPEDVFVPLSNIMKSSNRPTALLVISDVLTGPVIQWALGHGLKIPEELALVNYGNAALSRGLDITTIDQNPIAMGATAVDRILTRIVHPNLPAENLILPTQLIVRKTSSSPLL